MQLEAIGKCNRIPTANMYLESNTNKSFPFPSPPASMAGSSNSSSGNSSSGTGSNGKVSQQGGTTGSSGATHSLVQSLPLLGAVALALGSWLLIL
jgi:hypothetical protein